MSTLELNSAEFSRLSGQILQSGHSLRFKARGESMQPFILDGDILQVVPIGKRRLKWGDVVLAQNGDAKILVHRVIAVQHRNGDFEYLLKGDACVVRDGWFSSVNILGQVVLIEREGQSISLNSLTRLGWFRLWSIALSWSPKLTWLPERIRRNIRNCFLRNLTSF